MPGKRYKVHVKVPNIEFANTANYTHYFRTFSADVVKPDPFLLKLFPPKKVQNSVEILGSEEMTVNHHRGRPVFKAETMFLHDLDSYIWDEPCQGGSYNGYHYAVNNGDQIVQKKQSDDQKNMENMNSHQNIVFFMRFTTVLPNLFFSFFR